MKGMMKHGRLWLLSSQFSGHHSAQQSGPHMPLLPGRNSEQVPPRRDGLCTLSNPQNSVWLCRPTAIPQPSRARTHVSSWLVLLVEPETVLKPSSQQPGSSAFLFLTPLLFPLPCRVEHLPNFLSVSDRAPAWFISPLLCHPSPFSHFSPSYISSHWLVFCPLLRWPTHDDS